MLNFFKKLFTPTPQADFKELVKNGAVIVDVRTTGEFSGGHLKKSINIPLDTLPHDFTKLAKDKPLILCCASGMRSSSAKRMLHSKGFTDVHNGGSWTDLQRALAN